MLIGHLNVCLEVFASILSTFIGIFALLLSLSSLHNLDINLLTDMSFSRWPFPFVDSFPFCAKAF